MKDYTPYDAPHAPAKASQSRETDIRAQFLMSDAVRLSTLSTMLHRAEAKIAILEYTVKVYETHPLLVAYAALLTTEQQLIVVGEMVCPAAPTGRLREVGTLLDVLTRLGAQWRLFSAQVIRLDEKVEERKVS